MTKIFESRSLQLHNDSKMLPQLNSFFFFSIVTSIVYGRDTWISP